MTNESRSSNNEMTAVTPGTGRPDGAGARHEPITPPDWGGEYLDICDISDFDFTAKIRKNDPRIKALRDMGIGEKWLRIADTIGYESFMAVWKILSEDDINKVRVPKFSTYQRFYRNQIIKWLISNGMRYDQIRKYIKKNLREDVSLRHIYRIGDKVKVSK